MLRRCLLFCFLYLGLLRQPTVAQPSQTVTLSAHQVASVDQAMREQMEALQAVGLAIGIIQNNRIVYLNGYGWADREKKVPVTAKTLFRWASMSKTLTAVTALQLVEQHKLDLDADVRDYVPEFPDKGVPITTKQLLCHQSGIRHYTNGQVVTTKREYEVEHPFEDVVLALDEFKESPLLFAPGEKFSYSTHAYILLSAVAQRAGAEKFADQVQNRIAKPLGMSTLQPDYHWIKNEDRAVGYMKKGAQVAPSTDTDVSWKLGGGGFMSNILDMALFAQGLMNGRLLSEQTCTLAWQRQSTTEGELTNYGLGFVVGTEGNNQLKVSHGGSQEKTRCRMVLYPQRGTGAVVITNSEYVDPGVISTAIFKALRKS